MSLSWSLFFFSSRRRHTSSKRDWSSDVCSSDLHRPKAVWRVAQEIRDRHFAGEQKRDGTREEPDEEEQTSEGLQDGSQAEQRGDGHGAAPGHDRARKREQLSRSELHEEKGGDDAKHAEQPRGPTGPLRDQVRGGHGASFRWSVSRMARQRDSRLASARRSVHTANPPLGPRHRSSSTSRNRRASVRSVARSLNSNARSRPSPSTVAGKSSMRPYWFSSRAAVTAPIPGMPGYPSAASPTSARKSGIWTGVTPNFSRMPSALRIFRLLRSTCTTR